MATPVPAPTARSKITNRLILHLRFEFDREATGVAGPEWRGMALSGCCTCPKRSDEPCGVHKSDRALEARLPPPPDGRQPAELTTRSAGGSRRSPSTRADRVTAP